MSRWYNLLVEKYSTLNKAHWDERAAVHARSAGYGLQRYIDDPHYLSNVVRFDQPLLGDVARLKGVHLQCHIGTDTVSLARLGAEMTGVDFSPSSLDMARDFISKTSDSVTFVEADVYDSAEILGVGSYDLVYTGVGALCWLPDIERWAQTVSALLRSGGQLFIREAHPVLWAIDESRTDTLAIRYPYFEQVEPLVMAEEGTYVDADGTFEENTTHSWNHGIGEIISALLRAGLELKVFVEHDCVPWNALPGAMTRTTLGNWRLTVAPERIPASYTLKAVKSA